MSGSWFAINLFWPHGANMYIICPQSVCFITNVLDLAFASSVAVYRKNVHGSTLKKGWVTLTYGQLSSFCLRSGILRDFFSSLSWLLLFDLSSSLFFRFSCLILFFFCWEFRRLYFGRKIFRKAFRILGLDEKKGRWVVEQDFHGNFLVNVTLFFVFSTLCVTELSLFWYGLKDLFTLHKSAVKVVLDH